MIRRPRGTNDILPGDSEKWQLVEQKIREICRQYGYREIRTPIFEHTELFVRGIGETTDIVEKEMYSFIDRGERNLTLRPEGTAPVVRAFIDNKLYSNALPAKLYYIGPMFRYERPQAGRYRQFYQFGVEAIGSKDPILDVEMITLPIKFYQACGLEGFQVHINSIGCPECRPNYRQILKEILQPKVDDLCKSCQSRLEKNPLRILDCKVEACQNVIGDIPPVDESLCTECAEHFTAVKDYLKDLDVDYIINPRLVRGFDYYTKTVFEIVVASLGAQNAVGGGGRYDGLVEEIGGKTQPAVGFAVGLDRLILSLANQEASIFQEQQPDGYVATLGESTKKTAVTLVHQLRNKGFWVEMDYGTKSLRAQMKAANKLGVGWVLMIGEDELANNTVKIRWMKTSEEQLVSLNQVSDVLGDKKGDN